MWKEYNGDPNLLGGGSGSQDTITREFWRYKSASNLPAVPGLPKGVVL
jgi:hypothetical protein